MVERDRPLADRCDLHAPRISEIVSSACGNGYGRDISDYDHSAAHVGAEDEAFTKAILGNSV